MNTTNTVYRTTGAGVKRRFSGTKGSLMKMLVPACLVVLTETTLAQSQPLSLEQSVQMALQQNKEVVSKNLETEEQKQLKRASMEMPKTDVTLMYGQFNSIERKDNNFTFVQTFPFPTFFTANARLGNAHIRESELQTAETKNELAAQVKQTYISLQFLYEQQGLLLRQDSVFEELVQKTTLKVQSGEATLLEQLTAEHERDEIRNQLSQNAADLAVYLLQLQSLVEAEQAVTISERSLVPFVLAVPGDTAVVEGNPALQTAQLQTDIAAGEKKVAVAEAMPDFKAGYFNQTLIGTQDVDGEDVYFDGSDRFQGFQVGISVPLFFGSHAGKTKAAEIRKDIAGIEANTYKSELQSQFAQTFLEYEKSRSSLEYYVVTALPNAEKMAASAQEAFAGGKLEISDYLDAMETVCATRMAYFEALLDYNNNVIQLEFLAGKY